MTKRGEKNKTHPPGANGKTAYSRPALQYGVKKSASRMQLILDILASGMSVKAAAAAAGVDRTTALRWKNEDPEFRKAWEDAVEAGADVLEDEAFRRARDGVQKPVYQGGELVGHVQEYSDTLMQLLLRGRRPGRYKDRVSTELTGKDGGPIQTEDVSPRAVLAEKLAAIHGRTAGGPERERESETTGRVH